MKGVRFFISRSVDVFFRTDKKGVYQVTVYFEWKWNWWHSLR